MSPPAAQDDTCLDSTWSPSPPGRHGAWPRQRRLPQERRTYSFTTYGVMGDRTTVPVIPLAGAAAPADTETSTQGHDDPRNLSHRSTVARDCGCRSPDEPDDGADSCEYPPRPSSEPRARERACSRAWPSSRARCAYPRTTRSPRSGTGAECRSGRCTRKRSRSSSRR